MSPLRTALFIACGLGFSNADGSAQATRTTRPVGDTLYFVQTIRTTGFMSSAMMSDSVNSSMKMHFSYEYRPADTTVIWVDSATSAIKAGGMDQSMPLDMILKKKVVMHSPPGGKVVVVSNEFPEEFGSMMNESGMDLAGQMSKGGSLKKGTKWSDTTDLSQEMPGGMSMKGRDISHYEVVGDSVIAGYAVAIIAETGENVIDTSMSMGTASMAGKQTSKTEGRIYYSPVLQNALAITSRSTGGGTQSIAGQDMTTTNTTLIEMRIVTK